MSALAAQWIASGAAQDILDGVRAEAQARQLMARRVLQGAAVMAQDAPAEGIHQWLSLPAPWTANALARRATRAERGIFRCLPRRRGRAQRHPRVAGRRGRSRAAGTGAGNAGRADAQPAAAARRGGLSCAATAVLTAPRRSFEPRGAGQDGDDGRRAGHDSRRSVHLQVIHGPAPISVSSSGRPAVSASRPRRSASLLTGRRFRPMMMSPRCTRAATAPRSG